MKNQLVKFVLLLILVKIITSNKNHQLFNFINAGYSKSENRDVIKISDLQNNSYNHKSNSLFNNDLSFLETKDKNKIDDRNEDDVNKEEESEYTQRKSFKIKTINNNLKYNKEKDDEENTEELLKISSNNKKELSKINTLKIINDDKQDKINSHKMPVKNNHKQKPIHLQKKYKNFLINTMKEDKSDDIKMNHMPAIDIITTNKNKSKEEEVQLSQILRIVTDIKNSIIKNKFRNKSKKLFEKYYRIMNKNA